MFLYYYYALDHPKSEKDALSLEVCPPPKLSISAVRFVPCKTRRCSNVISENPSSFSQSEDEEVSQPLSTGEGSSLASWCQQSL
jgi:hypothetical protein